MTDEITNCPILPNVSLLHKCRRINFLIDLEGSIDQIIQYLFSSFYYTVYGVKELLKFKSISGNFVASHQNINATSIVSRIRTHSFNIFLLRKIYVVYWKMRLNLV